MNRKSIHAVSRRRFLKAAAVGPLAHGGFPLVVFSGKVEAFAGGRDVHPNISSLRVVGIHDSSMTKERLERSSWPQQEELVRAEVIYANMDRLACALTREKRPQKAWKAIFIKPVGKRWSDVVVAVKPNHALPSVQRPHSPVVAKICRVLTEIMGVRGENIFIYDAQHGENMSTKTPFKGLPDGVHVANKWGGINTSVRIPPPYRNGTTRSLCLSHVAEGEVDILVNIALTKGHRTGFGGFTQAMKNHFGTFIPYCRLGREGSFASYRNRGPYRGKHADYLLAVNKTPEILGKIDSRTGRVLFPRQQLCLVDALWASETGPHGTSTAQPNRIYMGTFAPVLDYQVATKFRRDIMGWRINEEVVRRFLSEFGYSPKELPNKGQIVDALHYTP